MKKSLILILAVLTLTSVLFLTACSQDGGDGTATADSAVDGMTPYSVDAEGNATSYYKNEYDDENRLIRKNIYDVEGTLTEYTTYSYDENGNENKEVTCSADDTILSQIVWERLPDGRPTKEIILEGEDLIKSTIKTEYTEAGKEAAIYEYGDKNQLIRYQIFEYNEEDELTRHTTYNEKDEVESYITYVKNDDGTFTEYTYDSEGHLISNAQETTAQ